MLIFKARVPILGRLTLQCPSALLRQARVRDAGVDDAWHTAATLLTVQGVHVGVVQEMLGHTSERMDQALLCQE